MRNKSSGFIGFVKGPVSVILMTSAFWHIVVWAAGIPFNYYVSLALFAVDLVVAYLLLDRLIYFFSQFILPIQNPKQRQEIYSRVKNFDGSNRGPALFIKNGRVIEHEGEADKHGPGLIVLDTASAAVLRTDTEIKDTIGPGVVFTKSYKKNGEHHNEYVAGSVDLRAQWQFIGPLASEQPFLNPASAPKPGLDPQKSRQQTNGLTRDGFEIVPTISIKFRIKRPVENRPTESGVTTEYEFDPESVRNAITREVVQLGTADNSKVRMEWNKLPAHLVVNLWREYIRKFKLGDLFTSTGVSGLQTIEDMINKRVRQKDAVALDDTGLPTGEWQESLEFRQLESRGLEIMEVRIHNVSFESEIEKQHIEQWSAEWLTLAKKEAQQLKEKETLIETAARDEASKTFARIASMPFHVTNKQPQQNPFKTLQLLILPLKDYLLSESNANTEMEAELRKLDDVWKWLLDNNPDGTGPRIHPGDKP